uniref:Amino acid transporter transmembrane domain-containing protein n=1 Tax=Calcidiscus leptoporus TaxID=127549 RepID=A0A7S0P156_9EUKA|mmetsp:Transcript_4344/g.9874  ORF Transcript_4344/g.9874 Transcript_4344/m.9874 type:complete len:701 (+) Transcript_4344:160-2262(+)|eukprot:CAMPEP_0119367358 /NCGR_PEP_ID=MMETSP1334-20130426/14141_1 /TAXON_ID=127549 /ORGANISM="Calcidiscus leptoporus, Strain RCC1130" /LENGTH=700 /DNA_ID=CAMNT_0007383751 /DNA_START=43 /DNA_END=2145 /DNA_ORIENTATION=+
MSGVPPTTTFTTAVNFVLGAGVLGLPFAVASAGIVASSASLVVVATLSMLTCSWLLEVGDRANALQNELSAEFALQNEPSAEFALGDEAARAGDALVCHADGGSSWLEPAAAFCGGKPRLGEPLLDRSTRKLVDKLHEYRTAYRSWRTGSHRGASDTQLRKLRPHLVYHPGRHRALLPLQLVPPPMIAGPVGQSDDFLLADDPQPLGSTACSSSNCSAKSLDIAAMREATPTEWGVAARPRVSTLRRVDSFSVDLANALKKLPGVAITDVDETDGYVPLPPPLQTSSPSTSSLGTVAADAAALPDWSVPSTISALEVTQLCNLFLGWRARNVWMASICMLHLSAMWACCAIWINSAQAVLSSSVTIAGEHAYVKVWLSTPAWLAICSAVLVPLSTLGGTERLGPALATATLTTLSLMCVLLVWALIESTEPSAGLPLVFGPSGGSIESGGGARPANTFQRLIFNSSRFGPSFSTFLFAFIAQPQVPSLVRNAAKPQLSRAALIAAISTCTVLYLTLGCSAAAAFGAATRPLITLNFEDFRGGAPAGTATPLWARCIARWVMLLPLMTTTAAFPLFNHVLAANLEGLLPVRLRSRRVAAALCALPPLFCTAYIRDTALVFAVCGLSGFAIVFFVPAALQRAAMRSSIRRWGAAGRSTPHTTVLSHEAAVIAVMGFGGAAFVYNLHGVLGLLSSNMGKSGRP